MKNEADNPDFAKNPHNPHRGGAEQTPAELRRVERLLARLGEHERACAPFGLEERIAEAAAGVGRSLGALAAAEGAMADGGLESRVYEGSRVVVTEAGARVKAAAAAPAGLEERIFEATRATIAEAGEPEAGPTIVMRIGRWSARLAAVLALGAGVWLGWSALRGGAEASDPARGTVVAADDELDFDEFDDVLTSHLAFMKTVEYRSSGTDLLREDWCTSCELLEIEEEIAS